MKSALMVAVPALLALGLSACAGDAPEPTAPDESLLVTAAAKGTKGAQNAGQIFEPARYIQERLYPAGSSLEGSATGADVLRRCQLNSYEDLDGNDFVTVDPGADSYHREHVNETDGFVMLWQKVGGGPGRITHIGRAAWNAAFWIDSPYLNDPNGHQLSVNSHAQGVVFPVPFGPDGSISDADVAELLEWFNQIDAEPGSWVSDGNGGLMPGKLGIGYDLLNEALGIIPVHPNPAKVGTEGRAVARLNQMLARYEDDLQGIECDADYGITDIAPNGAVSYRVKHNDVVLEKNWPRQLRRLFR